MSRIAVAEASIASRVRRSDSARSPRWSSSRAVRTARVWNRSSDDVMSERIAWSRDRSVMIRSCSGRTSRAEVRHTSVATSRSRPAACASKVRIPSDTRSSTVSWTEAAIWASAGVIMVAAGEGARRANSPRNRLSSSGSRVGPVSVIG